MWPVLVWFRHDLRLADNSALNAALRRGAPIIPVFIRDDAAEGQWQIGTAACDWLTLSLRRLDASLRERGSRLVLRRGDSLAVIQSLVRETGADVVYWNRRYEPWIETRDRSVAQALARCGVQALSFDGALLHDPCAVRNKQGTPFQVFTPFWRRCSELSVPAPEKLYQRELPAPARWPASDPLPPAASVPADWMPGEDGAMKRLRMFLRQKIEAYDKSRDIPAIDGTSRLSPHLRFGEITPRQIWAAVAAQSRETGVFPPNRGAAVFLKELGWREFAYHVLANFPALPVRPMREKFERFAWADDPQAINFTAWCEGRTGYPIVDAGMRELHATGWMHNRVRMIVASFLVKHLRLPWTQGAAFFWDALYDADLANNSLGWQWSAGCGPDAAPYFRIFSPVAQGRKFDAEGAYVRRWIPELSRLTVRFTHAPWEAHESVLAEAGIVLGRDYPRPLVDHATARRSALAAFQALKL